MATTQAQTLVSRALPSDKTLRFAGYALLAIAGSLLIAIAGQIKVPFYPVPATLQTLAIFMISAAYGRNLAVATLGLYLLEGAAGLPVFTGGAGIAYMVGPTGGYLAGFLAAAFIIGSAADRGATSRPLMLFGATLLGSIVILALGFAWLQGIIGAEKAWLGGVQPFILSDLTKVVLASAAIPALGAVFKRR